MRRTTRVGVLRGGWFARFTAVMVLPVTLVAGCADAGDVSEELSSLPASAVAALRVQPRGIESTRPSDVAYVYTFDGNGNLLGRLRGKSIHAAPVFSAGGGLVTALDDVVVTLSEDARRSAPVDTGSWVTAAVADAASGRSMVWFDTGGPKETGYTSTYVAAGVGNGVDRVGTVDGRVGTTAYCGDRNVTVSREVTYSMAPGRQSLHELGPEGELALLGQWDWPAGFNALTLAGACTPDGGELLGLYSNSDEPADGDGGLTLVRINTRDGTRVETRLELPEGHEWSTMGRVFSVVGDRVFWITSDQHVVSAALNGDPVVRHEWTLPGERMKTVAVVEGGTVLVVHSGDDPRYVEHGLLDGAVRGEPISLPWLADIVDGPTRSGSSTYGVSGVARLSSR